MSCGITAVEVLPSTLQPIDSKLLASLDAGGETPQAVTWQALVVPQSVIASLQMNKPALGCDNNRLSAICNTKPRKDHA